MQKKFKPLAICSKNTIRRCVPHSNKDLHIHILSDLRGWGPILGLGLKVLFGSYLRVLFEGLIWGSYLGSYLSPIWVLFEGPIWVQFEGPMWVLVEGPIWGPILFLFLFLADHNIGGWWPWWVMEAVAGRLSPLPASQPTIQAGAVSETSLIWDIFANLAHFLVNFAHFLVILPMFWGDFYVCVIFGTDSHQNQPVNQQTKEG